MLHCNHHEFVADGGDDYIDKGTRVGGCLMKMPVGETLEGAFSFAFRNILSVLGTVWFPYLIAAAIVGGAVYLVHPDWSAFTLASTDPTAFFAELRRVSLIFPVTWLVVLVTDSMVRVGLMRKALGLHEGPVFIYYSLGAPVWRMVGASLLLALIIFAIVIAAIAVCAGTIAVCGSYLQQPVRGLVDTIMVAAAILATFYTIIRFFFFLPAVVVAEERIGLGRAWELGRGNVLRIIVVVLAISLATQFVFGTLTSAIMPMGTFPRFGDHVVPQDVMNWEMNMLHTAGPWLLVIWVLQSIVTAALMTGAAAFAYRKVTAGDAVVTEGMHS